MLVTNTITLDIFRAKKITCNDDFTEGSIVTVNIDGKNYKRKVRYNRGYGLHILVKNYVLTYEDFN